jgi:hypothetical protein
MLKGLSHFLLALAIPVAAAAQSSREDGIRAFVAGEYARAAQVLGPLAEDPKAPDSVAAFLMAMLYESGRGVGRNYFRACALYLKSAAAPGPFTEQAAQLGQSMRDETAPRGAEFCNPGARWHTPPSAKFVLGSDHSVEFTSDRILVRYNGEEKQTMTGMLPDMIPLPVRYSPVDVTQPARARRHFVQWFAWWRDTPASWALGWTLSEVVGADYVPVTGEKGLLSSDDAEPPAVDVATLVRVRVSNTGEAEWAITGGVNPRSGIIQWRGPK